MNEVWLAQVMDYDFHGIDVVATTRDRAVEILRDQNPTLSFWVLDEDDDDSGGLRVTGSKSVGSAQNWVWRIDRHEVRR